jgi:hypothetical protein
MRYADIWPRYVKSSLKKENENRLTPDDCGVMVVALKRIWNSHDPLRPQALDRLRQVC